MRGVTKVAGNGPLRGAGRPRALRFCRRVTIPVVRWRALGLRFAFSTAMAATDTQMQTWERAEIERSSVEATLTSDAALRVTQGTFERY